MIYDTREELIDAICTGSIPTICVTSVTVMMLDDEPFSYRTLFARLEQAVRDYIAEEIRLATLLNDAHEVLTYVEQQVCGAYRDNAQRFLANLSRAAMHDLVRTH